MLSKNKLTLETPAWAEPLLQPARYKGAKGGRASGKSHFFAEMLIEEHILYPDLQSVCIREIQRSLKFSAKKLIEQKIHDMGVQKLFEITLTEIRYRKGRGLIIFEGMQDHTADSIKSLEGFDRAWVEEDQSLSHRSLELLIPTIRKPKSELWFSWNPNQPEDAVEKLFAANPGAILVTVNYLDNPWCPQEMIDLANWQKETDFERYLHIWEGGYNTKQDAQVLNGKWTIGEFSPQDNWDGPYFGEDWGFSTDPTALIKFWIANGNLYIEQERYGHGVEVVDLPAFTDAMPGANQHVIRSDASRPEIISHMQTHGFPKLIAADKWPGSVEDGISWLRGHKQIIIHPDCKNLIEEARLWSYKTDKAGNVLPQLKPGYDHGWDAVRYGAAPLIRRGVQIPTSEREMVDPVATYRLAGSVWVADKEGNFKAWEEPSGPYVVGAVRQKTALGGAAVQVIHQSTGRQAACWQGEATPEQLAAIIAEIARRYNNAWAVVDSSDVGAVIIEHLLRRHKRVYSEVPPGRKTGKLAGRRQFGFRGDVHIDALINMLSADIATNTDGVQCAQTMDEIGKIKRTDAGIEIDTAVPCERAWAYCLARHGRSTLPKPSVSYAAQPTTVSGWRGHV